jgi:proton-translocating NADH-quinone oxidoreductase chain M
LGYGVIEIEKRLQHIVFFLYTLFGSILMLFSILYLFLTLCDLNYETLFLIKKSVPVFIQDIMFFCFFIGFAVKIPSFPFHVWLPEAHVEAPTLGSVSLAGILLKLGGYGIFRFLLPIFPGSVIKFQSVIFTICIISILYSAFIGICQLDLKKIVAYSSITHMNFTLVGLFSANQVSLEGSIYSMFSHGLVASALFLSVGILYERYKTRFIGYYSGLSSVMPIFSTFFFILIMANTGIPPLSGFISEFLILVGLVNNTNSFLIISIFLSTILLTANFFWLFNRICTGPVSVHFKKVSDLTFEESIALLIFFIYIFSIGIWPNVIMFFCYEPTFNIVLCFINYSRI